VPALPLAQATCELTAERPRRREVTPVSAVAVQVGTLGVMPTDIEVTRDRATIGFMVV
jgi:hypothetical protein